MSIADRYNAACRSLFLFIVGMCLLVWVAMSLCGCATNGVTSDSFPAGVPCVQARAEAVRWYVDRYHAQPVVPPVRVIITENPPQGAGGLCRGSGSGYVIELWRKQNPFYGSLVHEFRHSLVLKNRGDHSEGAVQ